MAGNRHLMAGLQIGDGSFPRFDAVQKVTGMEPIVTGGIASFVFFGCGPEFFRTFIDRLRAADRMPSRYDFGYGVGRVYFLVGENLVASTSGGERTFGAVESEATHAETFAPGGGFAVLADRIEFAVFDNRVLSIGHLAIVFEEESSAGAVNGFRSADIEKKLDEIQRVLA